MEYVCMCAMYNVHIWMFEKHFYRFESFGIVCGMCVLFCWSPYRVAWITMLLGIFLNSHSSLISMKTLYPPSVRVCVSECVFLVEIPSKHFNKLKCWSELEWQFQQQQHQKSHTQTQAQQKKLSEFLHKWQPNTNSLEIPKNQKKLNWK